MASAPGEGTTFTVLLPTASPAEQQEEPIPRPRVEAGGETILVVDDQTPVRRVVGRILRSHGYMVLEADRGEAAVALTSVHEGPIDALLTDLQMPGMNGHALAARLTRDLSALRVLVLTGNPAARGQTGSSAWPLLRKPFTAEQLLARVRQVLDS